LPGITEALTFIEACYIERVATVKKGSNVHIQLPRSIYCSIWI